jgi:hypothetical protein
VVALLAGQTEESLLEKGVGSVPQRQGPGRCSARRRTCPPCHPRSSGTPSKRPVRTGSRTRRPRRRSSPPARCPTPVRPGTAPSAATEGRRDRPVGDAPVRPASAHARRRGGWGW